MLLSYRGRRSFVGPRTWHVAQVVGFEPDSSVVHIATLVENPRDEIFEFDVGFLPLTRRAFERSALRSLDAELPVMPFLPALLNWRRRRQEIGDVAAFSVQAWVAESLAWQTLRQYEPSATLETSVIEYAYPVRGRDGRFRTVEVAARQRTHASREPDRPE
jgi:hypothetical protein